MKTIVTLLMMVSAIGVMANEAKQKTPNSFMGQSGLEELTSNPDFTKTQSVISLDLGWFVVDSDLPPIVVTPPACYGSPGLCNLLISMLAAGHADNLPAGCHRSGALGSNVYYCQIK